MDHRLSRFADAAVRVIACAAAVLLMGTGWADAQTPNTNEEGRQKNRRVELVISPKP